MAQSQPVHGVEAFRDIVASLPAALYTTDADGRITYYNDAAASFWGRRPVLGREMWCGSWRLYWPDGSPMPHDMCPMATAIKTAEPVRGAQAIAERPDGVRVNFTSFPTPMFGARGELTGAVNILLETDARSHPQVGIAPRVVGDAPTAARDHATAALFEQLSRMLQMKDPGVSPAQWAILRYMARSRRDRTTAQIAGYLDLSEAGVERDVSVLVRHGLMIRAGDVSGGSGQVKLTERGRDTLQFDPVKRLAAAIGQLGETRRAALAEDLEVVAETLARDTPEPEVE